MDSVLCDDVLEIIIIDALGWGADLHALARVNRHLHGLACVHCNRHRALHEVRVHVFSIRHGSVTHDGLGHAQMLWRRFAPDAWKAKLIHHSMVLRMANLDVYTFADLMDGRVHVCPTGRTVHAPPGPNTRGSGCPPCGRAHAKSRASKMYGQFDF